MSVEEAIREAVVEALRSHAGQEALRRALEQVHVHGEVIHHDDDQAYTVAQVAALSGYAADTILERISDRDLTAYKPTGCREWRIRRQDYRAWLTGRDQGDDVDLDLDPEAVARKMLSKP